MAARGAELTPVDLLDDLRISEFCRSVFGSMTRSDQRRWGELYVRGLISVPGRKSIRRISDLIAGQDAIQSLQQFVNQSPWDWVPVRRALADQLSRSLRPKAWVVRELVFPKNGDDSVAVARQYASSEGRILNCQRALAVFLAGDEGGGAANWRLIMPRSWDGAEGRRAKTGVPRHERAQPDWQYLLGALDEMVGDWGLPPAPVLLSLSNDRDVHPLLRGLEERGLSYLVKVPPATSLAVAGGADRAPSAGQLAAMAARRGLTTLAWTDGPGGGLIRSRYVTTAVPGLPTVGGIGRGVAQRRSRLVLGEWPAGRAALGSVWLTDLGGTGTVELAGLLRTRRQVALDVEDLTEGAGLRHFEGRSFRGWHHHVTLASVAHGYQLVRRLDTRLARQPLPIPA